MKKYLVSILTVFSLAVPVFAANVLDVSGNRMDRIIEEMKDNWHALATGGTLTNGLTVTGTVTCDVMAATKTNQTLTGGTQISDYYTNTAVKVWSGSAATVSCPMTFSGGTNSFTGTMTASGSQTFTGTTALNGTTTIAGGTNTISGVVTISGALTSSGGQTLTGTTALNGTTTIAGGTNTISGPITISGALTSQVKPYWTNAATASGSAFTNIFDANGILVSHTP